MKDLLHARHRPALVRFLGETAPAAILLAFDYDGVLAPLVKDPSGGKMRPGTRALLARVARLYPVAVVSGRAWKDTHRFVGALVPTVVGNHGFELGHPVPVPAAVVRRVRAWRRKLEDALADVPGVYFEDKRSTLAVHYGLSRGWRRAERAVYDAAKQLEGTRLIAGKKVLNILPREFPSKGDAVRALVAKLGCEAALYAGDDVTDEDVFVIGPPLVFGVHVGKGPSLAPWRLRTQEDVDALLRLLAAAREGVREAPRVAGSGRPAGRVAGRVAGRAASAGRSRRRGAGAARRARGTVRGRARGTRGRAR